MHRNKDNILFYEIYYLYLQHLKLLLWKNANIQYSLMCELLKHEQRIFIIHHFVV